MTISATTQGLRMGVATSSSRPTVPFDGQVISETDTDSLSVYNGTAWLGAQLGAWTSYTPVIKGGATTVSATIQYAKYVQIGKTVNVRVEATITSAGAANARITVTLPVQPTGTLSTASVFGTFFILKSSVAFYQGAAILDGTSPSIVCSGTSYGTGDFMGNTGPSITLGNNDKVSFSVCYEVA